ncbi:subtilisin family serine protease [Spirosoma lacussanchae]|uniref:S8 family peptidase n=1 Tax=Spirosoma lacussanchae TaxID=1884249 RepID=UPI001109B5D5|nr:S8 family serine peptidase [Spirosoma lacussanchae]
MNPLNGQPQPIAPVERPQQVDVMLELIQTSSFIQATTARSSFNVSGKNLTAAVLDTGLRTTHVDFAGKVVAQRNFTADNGGNVNNASDGNGHGTNVGGIIVANKINIGIAPGANIVPLKVLSNTGGGSFTAVRDALQWVLDNHVAHKISVVNLSLGDSGNYPNDDAFAADSVRDLIKKLSAKRVAVVIAAGNDFFKHNSKQGMGYPGICREAISVGAVYDANEGAFSYLSGAKAFSTGPGRLTPFTQRLHETSHAACRTDIFAPGAPITSSGITSDTAFSIQHGTSQASPVTAGVVLLLQEYYQRVAKTLAARYPATFKAPFLPSVPLLVQCLREGGVAIKDGDDEDDNVVNTGLTYIRLDALLALRRMSRYFRRYLLLPFNEQQTANPKTEMLVEYEVPELALQD